MSLTEISLNIPTEHVANVFGQFDAYIKKIERTLNVTVVVRGDSMKLIGNERQIKSASNVFMQLLELSKRGKCHHGAECELCIVFSGGGERICDRRDR